MELICCRPEWFDGEMQLVVLVVLAAGLLRLVVAQRLLQLQQPLAVRLRVGVRLAADAAQTSHSHNLTYLLTVIS